MSLRLQFDLTRDSYNTMVTDDLEVKIMDSGVAFKVNDREVEISKEDAMTLAQVILISEV